MIQVWHLCWRCRSLFNLVVVLLDCWQRLERPVQLEAYRDRDPGNRSRLFKLSDWIHCRWRRGPHRHLTAQGLCVTLGAYARESQLPKANNSAEAAAWWGVLSGGI